MRCRCALSHSGQGGFQGQTIPMIKMRGAAVGMWWVPPWLTYSHGYQDKARQYCLVEILTLPAFTAIRTVEISILIFDSKQVTSLLCDN